MRATVGPLLENRQNVALIEPLPYGDFVHLVGGRRRDPHGQRGVQEEAPFLGTPVLVMRTVTERPEAVESGAARLVGTDRAAIAGAAREVLADPGAFVPPCPVLFGDGRASERILARIRASFGEGPLPDESDPMADETAASTL